MAKQLLSSKALKQHNQAIEAVLSNAALSEDEKLEACRQLVAKLPRVPLPPYLFNDSWIEVR